MLNSGQEAAPTRRRRAVVTGKGGRAELIGWEPGPPGCSPGILHGREHGPLFLTDLAPAPARHPPRRPRPRQHWSTHGSLSPRSGRVGAFQQLKAGLIDDEESPGIPRVLPGFRVRRV